MNMGTIYFAFLQKLSTGVSQFVLLTAYGTTSVYRGRAILEHGNSTKMVT